MSGTMFLCTRSAKDTCRFCTKVYINHKKISGYIIDKLPVQINDYTPTQLRYGVLLGEQITVFVHSSVVNRQKLFDVGNCNCGILFYESINSPFLLWKFYLDILARIFFNV